jgi:trypsin
VHFGSVFYRRRTLRRFVAVVVAISFTSSIGIADAAPPEPPLATDESAPTEPSTTITDETLSAIGDSESAAGPGTHESPSTDSVEALSEATPDRLTEFLEKFRSERIEASAGNSAKRSPLLDSTGRDAEHKSRAYVTVTDTLYDSTYGWGVSDITSGSIETARLDGQPALIGFVDTRSWSNPFNNDWYYGMTFAAWYLDVNNDDVEDYTMLFINLGGSIWPTLFDRNYNEVNCSGWWDINVVYNTYAAAFPLRCINDPARIRTSIRFQYDDYFFARKSNDYAPNFGWSAWLTNDLRASAPAAPARPTLSPRTGGLAVSWPAVTDPAGASVTDYVVQYSLASPLSWQTFADGVSRTPGTTITGLSASRDYVVRVAAKNRIGTGSWSPTSTASRPLPPPTPPGAPTRPWASAANKSVALSWRPPSSSGSAAIVDYLVQVSSNAGSTWFTVADGTTNRPSTTVTGLADDTAHVFRVAAVTSAGAGPWSPASPSVKTRALPSTPLGLEADATADAVTISWSPPQNTGGAPLQSIELQYRPATLAPTVAPRIVGGSPTTISNVPWQVAVQTPSGACGGVLVRSSAVVTAAHCVDDVTAGAVRVFSGVTNQSSMTTWTTVNRIILHPGWNPSTNRNDIAILTLASPAVGIPIDLLRASGPAMGASASISGWGTTSFGGSMTDALHRASVQILSRPNGVCGSYGTDYHHASMICAGMPNGGVDTCQGDSGGPLVVGSGASVRLVGITSFGRGCGNAAYPGVYTRVSAFRQWLESHLDAEWTSVVLPCGTASCSNFTHRSITDLDSFEYRARAVTEVGVSEWTPTSGAKSPAPSTAVPATPPIGLTATPLDGRVSLTWSQPSDSGGAAVLDYEVAAFEADGTTPARNVTNATRRVGGPMRSFNFTGLTNDSVYRFRVTAVTVAGSGAASPASAQVRPARTGAVSISPKRLVDTRATGATVDRLFQRGGALTPNTTTRFTLRGRGGIPANATSVAIAVTAFAPATAGAIQIFACGAGRPASSQLQFAAGENTSTSVTVAIGATGEVCVHTTARTDITVDAFAHFVATSRFTPRNATVVHDSLRAAGTTLTLPIAGRAGVPSGAAGTLVNVSVINPQTSGRLKVYPCAAGAPTLSTLPYRAGRTVSTQILVASTTVCVQTTAQVRVRVDVAGHFHQGAPLRMLQQPQRVVDTRPTGATVDRVLQAFGTVKKDTPLTIPLTGRAGVQSTPGTALLHIDVIDAAHPGTIRVYPCGTSPSTSVAVAFPKSHSTHALVYATPSANGDVCITSTRGAHLVVSVVGTLNRN